MIKGGSNLLKKPEVGIFIIRLVLGTIFFAHGLKKVQSGVHGSADLFEKLGIYGWLAYPVVYIELIGGILIILGVGTRIAAALLTGVMFGAIFLVKLPYGLVGGFEFPLALAAMSLLLVFNPSHYLSLEKLLYRRKNRQQQPA
jgi:putative oxidoreductase